MAACAGSCGVFPSGVTLIDPRIFRLPWSTTVTVPSRRLPTTTTGRAAAGVADASSTASAATTQQLLTIRLIWPPPYLLLGAIERPGIGRDVHRVLLED